MYHIEGVKHLLSICEEGFSDFWNGLAMMIRLAGYNRIQLDDKLFQVNLEPSGDGEQRVLAKLDRSLLIKFLHVLKKSSSSLGE